MTDRQYNVQNKKTNKHWLIRICRWRIDNTLWLTNVCSSFYFGHCIVYPSHCIVYPSSTNSYYLFVSSYFSYNEILIRNCSLCQKVTSFILIKTPVTYCWSCLDLEFMYYFSLKLKLFRKCLYLFHFEDIK
jgi:hypothetical protein